MSDHYYSEQPKTDHQHNVFETVLKGNRCKFMTDAGVFSKRDVDFGSRLLIETVVLSEREKLLDVGCGYGPIGIALAKHIPDGSVRMVDVNERAIELAKKNLRLNDISNAEVEQCNGAERLPGSDYTTIVSNPPIRAGKQVVYGIFEQSAKRLASGGALWIVIQKKQGAPSAYKHLQTLFDDVVEVNKSKGYRIFRASHTKK